jgi:hypothetical protein
MTAPGARRRSRPGRAAPFMTSGMARPGGAARATGATRRARACGYSAVYPQGRRQGLPAHCARLDHAGGGMWPPEKRPGPGENESSGRGRARGDVS